MALTDTSHVISTADYTIGTGTDKTFNKIESNGTTTRRRDTSTTSGEPQDIVIKHSTSGSEKNGDAIDRHLVQITHIDHDAQGLAQPLTINVTIAVPRNMWSNAGARLRWNTVVNLLGTSGYFDALLRGEG